MTESGRSGAFLCESHTELWFAASNECSLLCKSVSLWFVM